MPNAQTDLVRHAFKIHFVILFLLTEYSQVKPICLFGVRLPLAGLKNLPDTRSCVMYDPSLIYSIHDCQHFHISCIFLGHTS